MNWLIILCFSTLYLVEVIPLSIIPTIELSPLPLFQRGKQVTPTFGKKCEGDSQDATKVVFTATKDDTNLIQACIISHTIKTLQPFQEN